MSNLRNMTITLDAEAARRARVWAAEHGMSVSRFVGRLLESRMLDETEYGQAMARSLARKPVRLKPRGRYASRDEIYDRAVLRR